MKAESKMKVKVLRSDRFLARLQKLEADAKKLEEHNKQMTELLKILKEEK